MDEGAGQFSPGEYPKASESDLIGFPEEEISDPSDDEDKAVKQPKRLHGRVLKTRSRWTKESLEQQVEARAHVSGTAPVVLASALGLCQADKANPTEIENIVSLLGGILVIPTFDRGDYHSVAEAYAGIHYYKNAIINGIFSDKDPRLSSLTITPKEALRSGLKLMVRCLEGSYGQGADRVVEEYLVDSGEKETLPSERQYREVQRRKTVDRSSLYRKALQSIKYERVDS